MISIDTLRADHLGAYGYSRNTSPFFDHLAARGTLFENAIVQLPGTLPSHMSIFTGLYPAEHAVYPPDSILSPQIPTLPEVFRQHGFRTAGFTEGGYMSGRFGFARGFEVFDDTASGRPEDVETTFRRGLDFLSDLRPSERFFVFLHTYAVHDPYNPPKPYPSLFHTGPPPPGAFDPTGSALSEVNERRRSITMEVALYFEALYDAGIRYLDDTLGSFHAELESLGLADDTTIVLTSDHGEEFLEHGKMVHEQVYHETLHVPLLVLHPRRPGPRRVADLVQSIDLAPTLLELAGIRAPGRFSGRSLVAYLSNPQLKLGERAYAEAFISGDRSLYRQVPGALHQLVVRRPQSAAGTAIWITRSITFDAVDRLQFKAGSFHVPRQVAVLVDGTQQSTLALTPKKRSFTIELGAAGGKHKITLETPGCDSPKDLGLSEDRRCLSFVLEGLPLERGELFELLTDPDATRDLSNERRSVYWELYRELRSYEWQPVASSGTQELDPELEQRLKSLGYLE